MRACRLASLLAVDGAVPVWRWLRATQVGWLLTDASVFRTMAAVWVHHGSPHCLADGNVSVRAPCASRRVRAGRPPARVRETPQACGSDVRSSQEVGRAGDRVERVVASKVRRQCREGAPHRSASHAERPEHPPRIQHVGRHAGDGSAADSPGNGSRPARKEKRRVTADASTGYQASSGRRCASRTTISWRIRAQAVQSRAEAAAQAASPGAAAVIPDPRRVLRTLLQPSQARGPSRSGSSPFDQSHAQALI